MRVVGDITRDAKIISPPFETTELMLQLIKKYQIKGSEIFDAYLVATALSNGIKKIASDNTKQFQKYSEIEVVNPFI